MAKWKEIKTVYNEQNNFWVKVPKNQEHFTDENIETNFKDIDTFEFYFKNFSKEQVLSLVTETTTDEKTTVKNQIERFISNIINWKNVQVKDLVPNHNNEDLLDFEVEAFDELLANNLWIAFVLIKQINKFIIDKKTKIEEQKKT